MAIAQIKITYKQHIDARAKSDFERDIFDTSYSEFLLRAAVYNLESKVKTFSHLKEVDARASTLHYSLSISIMHLLAQLNNQIPNLKDLLGQSIAFETSDLQLIESDLSDWAKHSFSINYTTGNLILHKIIGDVLLLSVPVSNPDSRTEEASTFMLKLQPNMAITGYQEYQNRMASDFTGFASN